MGARLLAPAMALLLMASAVAFIVQPVGAALTEEWMPEGPIDQARSQAVTVVVDDVAYVIGGVKNATTYTPVPDVWACDLTTGTWTELAPMPVGTRGSAGAVGLDGMIYVFSGWNDTAGGTVVNTQIYDPVTDAWSAGTDVPTPVWEAKAATYYDGTIWVAGGESGGPIADVQIYDPDTDAWSAGTPLPATAIGGAMLSIGSTVYYSGGGSGGYTVSDVFYRWDSWMSAWTVLDPLPEARAAHSLVLGADNAIYLVGGSDNVMNVGNPAYNTTFVLHRDTNTWTQGPDLDSARKYGDVVASSEGFLFALGGNAGTAMVTMMESLQLYEYSVSLSSEEAAAGKSVLLNLDASFAFVEEDDCYVYWYLASADGTVYATQQAYNPTSGALALEIGIPTLAAPGEYVVAVEWEIDLEYGYLYVTDIELPLTVLPEVPVEDLISDLEAQIADLEAQLVDLESRLADLESRLADLETQLGDLNDSVAAGDAALADQIAALQAALDDLNDAMESGDADLMDEISALQDQITATQAGLDDVLASLNDTQESVDDVSSSIDNKMDSTLGYAVIGLLVVVVVLLVAMMVMGRRPKVPAPPSE